MTQLLRWPEVISRPPFRDRAAAARDLAISLREFSAAHDVTVVALARGGVPVARAVADSLNVAFDVFVCRSIAVPGIDEVALGAVAEGSQSMVADVSAWNFGVPSKVVSFLTARARTEVQRQAQLYRQGQALSRIQNRTVILIDDGLASGAKMLAAIRALRRLRPRRMVVAVPAATPSGVHMVRGEADRLIVLRTLEEFEPVSSAFEQFAEVTDEDVLAYLDVRPDNAAPATHLIFSNELRDVSDRICYTAPYDCRERACEVPVLDGHLSAHLGLPQQSALTFDSVMPAPARGLVVLAHDAADSRDGYRNRYIAGRLRLDGYATLRVNLQTRAEQRAAVDGRDTTFDVTQTSGRLLDTFAWATRAGIDGADRRILFAAGDSAAAALLAATRRAGHIHAVITRRGSVQLATNWLPDVHAPVLMVVGGTDRDALYSSTRAVRSLARGAKLVRVRGAGRSFDEPGALGEVAEHTVRWLNQLDVETPGLARTAGKAIPRALERLG